MTPPHPYLGLSPKLNQFFSAFLNRKKYASFHLSDSIREVFMQEKGSFFNIVQKAFDSPPLSFEHYVVIFLKKF